MKKDSERVVEAVDLKEDDLIRLSSGVVLCGKMAPPLTLIKVMAAYPRPKPPVYFNQTMGREIENPDDPDYLERVREHQTESGNAMLNALIILGTELVEVPKKFPRPESNEWLEEYAELGLPMRPENKTWRYLTWMTFKAVTRKEDLDMIQKVVGRLSGVPEGAVKSAEEFPGRNQTGR